MRLETLDLVAVRSDKFGETALCRMINGSNKTLETFKINFKVPSLGKMLCSRLSFCVNLQNLELGQVNDYIDKGNIDLRAGLLKFIAIKKCSLRSLKLYECDANILKQLSKSSEQESLKELTIVKFFQSPDNKDNAKDLVPLKEFRNLERLSLCASYFPLNVKPSDVSHQAEYTNTAVSGCRELEQVLFSLRYTLYHVAFGNYIWDDLIVYMAEICKELEVVEFNSDTLTDAAISHLIKRAEHLTAIDVSGCKEFMGLAFADCDQTNFKSKKLKWVQLNLHGHEKQMAIDRLKELAPQCQVVL